MATLRFSEYTDSPTIFLPPQPIQPFNSMSYSSVTPQNRPRRPIMSHRSKKFSRWTLAPASQDKTNPSRKRSRDECSDEQSEPGFAQQPGNLTTIPNSTHGIVVSPTNPLNDVPMSAESQTGEWPEEKLHIELQANNVATSQAENQLEETSIPRTKFQRRDTSSDSDGERDPSRASNNSLKSTGEGPIIDQFTHFLGIGWARVSDDADMQAATRGWARYIENHYPISAVRLVLRSHGLEAYLAETKQGYFLFRDDLDECRLVGSCWETSMANLKHCPILYEGTKNLKASRTVMTPTPTPILSSSLTSHIPGIHSTPAEDIMVLV